MPITNVGDAEIEHVVALKWAWDHGAWKWSDVQRAAFANDPRNLAVTTRSMNAPKGAAGLGEWVPPDEHAAKALAARQAWIVKRYALTM